MNNESLIKSIYGHICLPMPKEIIEFPSVADAFNEFKVWSKLVEKVMPCYWSYQFPIASPSSYWGTYQLKKDGYRLDVKRSPNEHGCFVYGEHINKQTNNILTKELYNDVCSELGQQEFEITYDKLVDNILEKYEREIDLLDGLMYKEDPTCQVGVDGFIFLGNFEWLQKELWLLSKFKNIFNIPINEDYLSALKKIQERNKLFITFSNIVVVAG